MKPLDKECAEQSCWCHKNIGSLNREAFIENIHTEHNACEWVELLADLFLDKAYPIARWGGDCKYDGALNLLWQKMCEKRGLTPVNIVAATVEERQALSNPAKPHPNRRKISDRTRLRIYERDGYVCVMCGSNKNLTLDHILALANGGGNEEENLQTMCKTCNTRKGVKPWQSSEQQTI